MAVAERTEEVPLSVILALFTGDDYSEPCYDVGLVVAICKRTNPTDLSHLLRWIWPWEKEHHVPDEIRRVVKRGYEKWAHCSTAS